MNNLIKTFTQKDGTVAVDGRDLHDFLGVHEKYTQWFDRMITYGFDVNIDFVSFSEKTDKPQGGRPQLNHALTLDMAKELSMIQRTEKGKQARQYFISIDEEHRQNIVPMTKEEKIHLLAQNGDRANQRIRKVEHRQDSIEQDVQELKEDQVISNPEYTALSRRVNQRVSEVAHSFGHVTKEQRGKLFKDINGGIKQIAGVSSRSMLRKKDYQMVMDFINDWEPSTATKTIIRQTSLKL